MADSQLRRSMLYVPGNMPSMLQNVPLFKCDSVIIDLEDAVNYAEKDAARNLVRRFLSTWKDRNKEVLVRINPLYTKWGHDDLKMILPEMPDAIRFPMCETAEHALELDAERLMLERLEQTAADWPPGETAATWLERLCVEQPPAALLASLRAAAAQD